MSAAPPQPPVPWRAGLILLFVLLAWTGWALRKQPWGVHASQFCRATEYRIDVNAADEAELALLPGVGPGIARRMVAYRSENGPWKKGEELIEVAGIGPRILRKFKRLVQCGEAKSQTRP